MLIEENSSLRISKVFYRRQKDFAKSVPSFFGGEMPVDLVCCLFEVHLLDRPRIFGKWLVDYKKCQNCMLADFDFFEWLQIL